MHILKVRHLKEYIIYIYQKRKKKIKLNIFNKIISIQKERVGIGINNTRVYR